MAAGDVITGTPGNDSIFVSAGETGLGLDGDDFLVGSLGGGTADGGAGNDTYTPSPDFVPIITDLTEGRSYVIRPPGAAPIGGWLDQYNVRLLNIENVVAYGTEGEIIKGNEFDNILIGSAGSQGISGEAGNDTIRAGSSGNDDLNGGLGIDTIDFIGRGSVDIVLGFGSSTSGTVVFANGENVRFSDFENVRGSLSGDKIVGDRNANKIEGSWGDDMLSGGGGADTFVFTGLRLGHDTITDFSLVDDRLDIKSDTIALDTLLSRTEAAGDTTLFFEAGSVTIKGIVGLSLAQWQTYIVNSGFAVSNLGLTPLNIVGTSQADTLSGTQNGDNLIGLAGNDRFYGSAGADTISGGGGTADTLSFDFSRAGTGLFGTLGDRTFTITASGITDSAGQIDTTFSGVELVRLERGSNNGVRFNTSGRTIVDSSAFTGLSGVHVVNAFSDRLTFTGSAAGDFVGIGAGSNLLDGGGGIDSLQLLLDGTTTTTVTQSGSTVRIATGSNVTEAINFENIELDLWLGSGGSINAAGASSALTFNVRYAGSNMSYTGGSGGDRFANGTSGGTAGGITTMTGGAGADIYYYTHFGTNFDKDLIADLAIEDRIDLSGVGLFNPANPARFIGGAAFTRVVNQVRYEKSGATTLLQVDANGDSVADATLTIANGAFDLRETAAGSSVLAINQTPVISSNGGSATATRSLAENTTAVTTVLAADPDAGTTLTYAISGGADAARFQIDAASGALAFIAAPNFEAPTDAGANNVYDVIVSASDGTLTDTQAIAVTVTNANEAPVFGSEFLVNTQTASGQGNPEITGLANGDFVVTWYDLSGTLGDSSVGSIKAQMFRADGTKAGTEFLVNTQAAGRQMSPAVASLVGGGFVVTWTDSSRTLGDSDGESVKAQVFGADGSKIGTEFLVNTQTASHQVSSAIGRLAGGGFVITWNDYSGTLGDSSEGSIKAQVYGANGSKVGSEFLVNTQTASLQLVPRIAGLANGGFVITWQDFSGTQPDPDFGGIRAQVFSANGTKTGSEFLVNTLTALGQYNPSITSLANGSFVISWYERAVLPPSGEAIVKAQLYAASGTKIGPEFMVNTQTGVYQVWSKVAGLTNGGFVVTWTDGSGTLGDRTGLSVKAQAFGADGTKVGTEFLVNTQTAGDQQSATVAALANGGFAVTWTDASGTLGDSSGTSIKAQVFAIGNPAGTPVSISDGGGATVSRSIAENAAAVTTVQAFDPDAATTLTYAISGGADAAQFQINAATGALAFIAPADFEAPGDAGANNVYDVIVSASDGTLTGTQTLAVTVTNVAEAPVISSDGGGATASRAVAENTAAVTAVRATDPDAGARLTYSITGGADSGWFQIDPATGALSFFTALDFEFPADVGANNVYDVIVSVSDGTLTDTQALAVTLTNANEAPVISSDGGGATAFRLLAENTATVTSVIASDPDAGTVLTYAISGGADAARFQINAATGALSFRSAPNFEAPGDVGADNFYDVIVRASDGALVVTQALTVLVSNVNEAPAISSNGGGATAARSVAENTTAVTTVLAADPDAGTSPAYAISGGADAARFQINAATGALSFRTAPNFEAPGDAGANNVYDVIVSASDGIFTDTQAIAVTVTDVAEIIRGVRNDFNGDGRSDVLWRNANGQLSSWLGTANGGLQDNGAVVNQFVPTSWRIQGTADFNGDGRSDVLWRNVNGQLSSWLGTANGGLQDNGNVVNQFVPLDWKIAGTGDFNGDGRSDILWRNDNGRLSQWLGTANGGLSDNFANVNAFVPVSWNVAEVADFNGDGRADVLWRNNSGQLSQWLGTASGALTDNGALVNQFVPNAWKIQDAADFNGDGFADVLWRNDNGQLSQWLGSASGRLIDNGAVVNQFVPNAWKIAGTGDFNGDGRADILWRNDNGQLSEWLGNANGGFADNGGVVNQFVPNAWTIHIEDYQAI